MLNQRGAEDGIESGNNPLMTNNQNESGGNAVLETGFSTGSLHAHANPPNIRTSCSVNSSGLK